MELRINRVRIKRSRPVISIKFDLVQHLRDLCLVACLMQQEPFKERKNHLMRRVVVGVKGVSAEVNVLRKILEI